MTGHINTKITEKEKSSNTKNGIILLNKEKGISSRKLVEEIGRRENVKTGHIGTLDPMAEGLLPVLVGNACKLSTYLMEHDKQYLVEMKFGYETNTLDLEGTVIKEDLEFLEKNTVTDEFFNQIIDALRKIVGTYEQIPPIYSAKKLEGRKLYEIARQDEQKAILAAEKKKKKISVYNIWDISLKEIWTSTPKDIVLSFRISCSSGTYIRSIVRDIAYEMGTYATMTRLVREKVGNYSLEEIGTGETKKDVDAFSNEIYIEKYTEKYITEKEILEKEILEKYGKVELETKRLTPFLNGLDTNVDKEEGYKIVIIEDEIIGIGNVRNGKIRRKYVTHKYIGK